MQAMPSQGYAHALSLLEVMAHTQYTKVTPPPLLKLLPMPLSVIM
jgi:hypothetical protein